MFKDKRLIFALIAIVIVVSILIVALNIYNQQKKEKFIKAETERVLQYDKIADFQTIEEVFYYLDTKIISSEFSNKEDESYIIKAKLKYDAEYEYKNYYNKLIQYSAYVLKYKNFSIIDENKKINIFVVCNPDKKLITTYYINNKEKYFEILNSENNIKQFTQSSSIKVSTVSEELKQLILNNWTTSNQEGLGTQDSYFRNYDIYFDEGYEIRKVNGKVFNIVFTDKYKNEIIKNIKVGMTNENIKKVLGKPEFEAEGILGYKTEEYYIFFSKDQISIYPVVKYDSSKIVELINKNDGNTDFQSFVNNVRNIWKDYDSFESTGNKTIIKYTLKGITFKFDSSAKSGIIVYNNYSGKIVENKGLAEIANENISLPDKMYFENTNSVFEAEKVRISSLEDFSENGNFASGNILNISNKYKIIKNTNDVARFISINKQAPNVELRDNFNYGIWLDDYNFIYSIKGKGIYSFNVTTQKYSVIKEGNDDFRIYGIKDNNTLIYDQSQMAVGSH